jgi:hypothetical protein
VTDNDFKDTTMRETFKTLGAVWVRDLKGWVFPEASRLAVSKVIAGEEVDEDDLEGVVDPTADPSPSVNANAVLSVSMHKKAVLVSGDTREVKDVLKAMKGSWNKGVGGWIFPGSKKEQILRVLRADETNDVTEGKTKKKREEEEEDEESGEEDEKEEEEEEVVAVKSKRAKVSAKRDPDEELEDLLA